MPLAFAAAVGFASVGASGGRMVRVMCCGGECQWVLCKVSALKTYQIPTATAVGSLRSLVKSSRRSVRRRTYLCVPLPWEHKRGSTRGSGRNNQASDDCTCWLRVSAAFIASGAWERVSARVARDARVHSQVCGVVKLSQVVTDATVSCPPRRSPSTGSMCGRCSPCGRDCRRTCESVCERDEVWRGARTRYIAGRTS